jgi:heptosyltransferase-2
MKPHPESILVKPPNWLGDVVLCTPALRAIRASFPNAELCAVGNEIARAVISLLGLDARFVGFDRHARREGARSVTPHGPGPARQAGPASAESVEAKAGGGSWRAALSALRARRWDLGVAFAESFSSALLLRLAGARRTVGYSTDGRRFLLSVALRRERLGLRPHLVREYMALAEAAGAKRADEVPSLDLREPLKGEARALLSRVDLAADRPLVGLCPGAAYGPSKRWPAERFARVGRELGSQGASVAVFGSAAEVGLANEVSRTIPGSASLAGMTSVRLLAACLSQCAVVVANDSGAAHLAAAVGAPVVVIFGSTDASWTRPMGPRVAVVRTEDLPCVPCFGKECDRGYACLTGVSEGDVAAAARAVAAGGLD